MEEGRVLELSVPEPFVELFRPSKPWRHMVYYGGRSSGKSTQTALAKIVSGSQKRERGLCCREIQNSIRESVHQLFRDLINKYSFTDWEVQKDIITNKKK